MKSISEVLFIISNGLMIPVILGLLFLLVKALLLLAGFFKEYNMHKETKLLLSRQINLLKKEEPINSEALTRPLEETVTGGYYARLIQNNTDQTYCEYLLSQYQISVQKELNKSRMLIKFGPLLGLMGTLIPMGPALVGLAEGDISSMAYNMQIAFATTVTGMAAAAVGMLKLQFDQRFYATAYNDLEYLFIKKP